MFQTPPRGRGIASPARSSSRRSLVLALAGALVLALLPPGAGPVAGAPPGYYDSVDTTNATTLRLTLHEVIDDHQYYPYTSSGTDTWDILERAWEQPGLSTHILDVYKNASYWKQGGGNQFYDREHMWPKSYGFPDDNGSNYPYTDCFLLALCDSAYNSSRSNKPFRTCSAACTEKPTDVNNGTGGGTGVYPGNSNWTSGAFTQGTWEVWMDRRGDVARALLYADIRYEGGTHGVTGAPEPDLILTDSEALIDASNTGSNESVAYMGMLSTLLLWHDQDPVDADEMLRNDIVYSYQGNRNPFVDHPEWVDLLHGTSGAIPTLPWINEFHYDNVGNDLDEMVEIAGPAGLDLAGWDAVAYDGATGLTYMTVPLAGVLPDFGRCIGALSFPAAGLQNGAPDGIALVSPAGGVVEFLSYEGVFTALDGPAAGLVSIDVQLAESGSTPVGHSLQRGGQGTTAPDFHWQAPLARTPGAVNAGQTFLDGCPLATTFGCGVNPTGSMTVISGAPRLGTQMVLGLDNPLGTQAPGALTFLFVSAAADPNHPCGTSIPGFGMSGPGAAGELLISIVSPDPSVTQVGPPWGGSGLPAPVPLSIPGDTALVGLEVYGQGLLLDPGATFGVKFGLTDGVALPIGY